MPTPLAIALLVISFGALAAMLLYLSVVYERRRSAAMRDYAVNRGYVINSPQTNRRLKDQLKSTSGWSFIVPDWELGEAIEGDLNGLHFVAYRVHRGSGEGMQVMSRIEWTHTERYRRIDADRAKRLLDTARRQGSRKHLRYEYEERDARVVGIDNRGRIGWDDRSIDKFIRDTEQVARTLLDPS